jgi:adenylosuccinate lyase
MEDIHKIKSIHPIDNFYFDKVKDLSCIFSDYGFNKYRLSISCEYLIYILNYEGIDIELTMESKAIIKDIYKNFTIEDCLKLKSKNYNIVDYLTERIEDVNIVKFINFGIINEDIDSVSYTLMLKSSIQKVILPKINNILTQIKKMILEWSKLPILTYVQGFPSSPSFLGKELMVYYERLVIQSRKLNSVNYNCKFGGLNGNFNSLHMALPNIDWIEEMNLFLKKLGLNRNQYTTQIDHNDNICEIFDIMKRINNIFIDLSNDFQNYLSLNFFKLGKEGIKNINNFEESEVNFCLSNNLGDFLSNKLPISKLHGDFKSKIYMRYIGSVFTNTFLGLDFLNDGIHDLIINKDKMEEELVNKYDLIIDGFKTRLSVLDIEYDDNIFNTNINRENLTKIIDCLDITENEKKYLGTITPLNYTGIYKL